MYPYRVFIAYSHEDLAATKRVVKLLRDLGLRPMWDENLTPGIPFTDQIKNGISYAHVFLPVITEASSRRPWVHQEIGYAMALNVPVLPLAVGALPTGMPEQVQAITVNADWGDLGKRLTAQLIERTVLVSQTSARARFECAESPQQRTAMLVDYAKRILTLGEHGRVRQVGVLSSFSLPDKTIHHPAWDRRDGKRPRGDEFRRLLREERKVLEQHARVGGCDLIIDPAVTFASRGSVAREEALRTLLGFLETTSDEMIRVASCTMTEARNLTMVGDWFVAESVAPRSGVGWQQTIFTTHGPTVMTRMQEFDEELGELLDASGIRDDLSRLSVISRIGEELKA